MAESENIENIDPHIIRRYEIIQKIGKGAYGVVWRVADRQTRRIVALKKAYGAFSNCVDSQRTYREISILRQLRRHPNIIELLAVHRATNDRDIYIVFELMETDLYRVIRGNILMDIHHRYIYWQMLCGLKYLHSAGVVHRDLKPTNVLINSDATIKLCDFGLARAANPNNPPDDMTDYVATRWYRAPEILLGCSRYSPAVDIWAAGCILAELITGRPLFPGSSATDQLEVIVSFLGPPSQAEIDGMESQDAQSMISNLSFSKPRTAFEERMDNAPPDAIGLVRQMIVFNPLDRPTAEQALKHPYVAQFHSPRRETVADRIVEMALDDSVKHSIKDYRSQIYRETQSSSESWKRRTGNSRMGHTLH